MAGQGCPNEGTDKRIFGKFICYIQRKLKVKSIYEPISILFAFPFYIAINFPWPWSKPTIWGVKKNIHLRIGIRYDMNAHIYIISAAIKDSDRAIFY